MGGRARRLDSSGNGSGARSSTASRGSTKTVWPMRPIVYDTGVLIAADRSERQTWADHRIRLEAGIVPLNPCACGRAGEPLAQAGTDAASPSRMRHRPVRRGCGACGWRTARKDAHDRCRRRVRRGTGHAAPSRCRQRRRQGPSTPAIGRARDGIDSQHLNASTRAARVYRTLSQRRRSTRTPHKNR